MPRPRPPLLALLLLTFAVGARAEPIETCAPLEEADARAPVYVLLYGYPHATERPQTPSLTMVAHDLRHMDRFFAALGPTKRWVHAEDAFGLHHPFGPERREPTWRALSGTVAEMVTTLDAADHDVRPQIYLYFVGHGDQRDNAVMARGELYARPDPERSGPGHNGIIDARLLADRVLRPLADRADVHLIVDACQSFYLLSTRGGAVSGRTKRAIPAEELISPFTESLPGVGALLATNGTAELTWEDSRYGGLFSHAVRSAAIGPADLNRDGVVTYGEMHGVVGWILSGSNSGIRPATAPPGMDRDVPFIDWRQSDAAARICITPGVPGRQVIGTSANTFATVNAPPGPHRLYLAKGFAFRFERQGGPFEFTARDGTLDVSGRTAPEDFEKSYIEPFRHPLVAELLGEMPLAPPLVPGWYYGVGAVWHFAGMILALPDADFGLDFRGRFGRGLHRVLVDVGISRRDHEYRIGGDGDGEVLDPIFGVVGTRLGYSYLWYRDGWEIDAGLVGGVGWTLSRRWESGWLPDAALSTSAVRPFDGGKWALRLDLRAGALLLADDVIEPFVQLGIGADYESLFE